MKGLEIKQYSEKEWLLKAGSKMIIRHCDTEAEALEIKKAIDECYGLEGQGGFKNEN